MTIIKKSILLVSELLTYIVNLSIQHGIVPDEMKIARVIPIFKSDDQSLFTNYRPISVLPSFSKFFERSIYNRLMQYLMNFNILCSNQYGFRKNHSTALVLIDLHDKISTAFDRGEFSVRIFLDLSKAFDTVYHVILFDKLEQYGIRDLALDWIRSYFSNRKQYVEYNGHRSLRIEISCGVPLGSILGPLFFLLYINDIVSKCWSVFRSACTSRSWISDVFAPIFAVLLEHLRAFEVTWKRTQHCWSNIVGQQLPTLRPFARSLKEPIKCGLSEMNNVIGMNKSP